MFQRPAPARRIDSHRAQQVTKLPGAACVERTVHSLCQSRDLSESMFGDGIAALVKQEYRDIKNAQFTRKLAKYVNVFFHAVTYKYQRVDFSLPGLRYRMLKHLVHLRLSAEASYGRHAVLEIDGVS
jgi:hypothetical protein